MFEAKFHYAISMRACLSDFNTPIGKIQGGKNTVLCFLDRNKF